MILLAASSEEDLQVCGRAAQSCLIRERLSSAASAYDAGHRFWASCLRAASTAVASGPGMATSGCAAWH